MPKTYPIQQSFAAGEISPLLASRSDVEGYKNGCAIFENFLPSPHGPALGRSGSRFVDTFVDTNGQLFPFQISRTESYVVILTNLLISVADELGIKTSVNEITNSDFEDGSTGWTDISTGSASATFHSGYVELNSSASQNAAITQSLTLSGIPTNLHHLIFSGFDTGPMRIKIGTASGLGDILDTEELDDIGHIDFTPGVAAIWVTIFVPLGTNTRKISEIELREIIAGTEVEFVTPWSDDEIDDIQVSMPPRVNKMYFVHPNHPPYVLESSSPNAWTFAVVAFTAPPASWAVNNYPSVIAFFQGRMWLMGTPSDPETIWASVSNSYTNFTTGIVAADSQEFSISNKGMIEWAAGAKNFIIGTENGEHIVTSAGGVVWAEDFGIEQQSSYGSLSHQPIKIGNDVVFITPDRRKIRQMNYEFAADGWLSKDISFASEHITIGKIKDIIFAQHPGNVIWMTDFNGNAIACSYEKGNGIIGWSRHVTDGDIISMTVTEEFGQSVMWGLVDRSGGAGPFCLERFYTPEDVHYLDSYVTAHSTSDITVISGLDHLEGQTVQIEVDNAVHPDKIVSSGEVTLDYPGNHVAAGLQYIPKIITLRPDAGAPGGSSYPWKKRWNEIYVGLIDSHVPKINGERPPIRHPDTPMGEPEPKTSEPIKVSNLGNGDGIITIEQDLPLSCNISAIYGQMNQSAL